jgi:hypothetical protein
MYTKLLILISLTVTSCYQEGAQIYSCGTPKTHEFVEVVDEYLHWAAVLDTPPLLTLDIIRTDALPGVRVGQCDITENMHTTVTVESVKNVAGPYTWKAIVFHELAHCIHLAGHVEGDAILAPILTGGEFNYRQNWNEYVINMFMNIKLQPKSERLQLLDTL